MDTQQDRLLQFDRDLLSGKNICSSRGVLAVSYTHLTLPTT